MTQNEYKLFQQALKNTHSGRWSSHHMYKVVLNLREKLCEWQCVRGQAWSDSWFLWQSSPNEPAYVDM